MHRKRIAEVLGAALSMAMLGPQAPPAQAAEDVRLDGPEIAALLTDRTVRFEAARQVFYASGRTLYDTGRPEWGYWRVEGGQYCSQWPPNEAWACYDVFRADDGTVIWVGSGGTRYPGRLVPE